MPIRAVIFDLGGVLLRTADFSPRERLAAQFGMSRSELEQLVFGEEAGGRLQRGEISLEEHVSYVRRKLNCSPEDFAQIIETFFAEDRLDAELVDYIRQLHRSYKTGLLSNSADDLRVRISEQWYIDDVFDDIVISGEVGIAKPDPRIYRLAIDRLGVAVHEAVFVDDNPLNVDAARAVGLYAIQFQSPPQLFAELEQLLNSI